VRYAAGLANDSGTVPERPAQIINLSLGGAPFSQATQALFDEVRAAGVLVVAAAGNQASAAPVYPAAYNGVISVSAVDAQRRLAPYSSTGPGIDVAAPGGNNSVDLNGDGYPDGVLSTGGTVGNNGINFAYTFANGTSMASPHVAGVLALMKSVNAQLTPADIDAMLAAGELSDDLGAPGRDDQFGHGMINAQRSVLAALQAGGTTPADNPRLVASASALNFGRDTTSLTLILRNGENQRLALALGDLARDARIGRAATAQLAAIDGHQHVGRAARLLVDDAGDVHLAGAGRADDRDGDVQRGEEQRLVDCALHVVDDIAFYVFFNRGNRRR
jgi:serine protease